MECIGSKFSIYTKNNKLVEGEVSFDDLYELSKLQFESLEQMILEDVPDYKYELSFNEYLFVCLKFFVDSNCIDSNLDYSTIDKISRISTAYREILNYVDYTDFILRENETCGFKSFEINEELVSELNKNMNPHYSLEEKIYYYYLKLCFLLEPDSYQNFCFSISTFEAIKHFKKSPNRISQITPNNNEASCFEFDAILSKLIELSGGIVYYNEFKGDSRHVDTVAIIDKLVCKFDAYNPPDGDFNLGRDITNIKSNSWYSGIYLDSSSKFFSNKDLLTRVYNDVQEEFSEYKEKSKFSDDELSGCFDIIDDLNLPEMKKKKIKECFNKLNRLPFSSVVFVGYVLWNHLVDEEDVEWLKLIGVETVFEDFSLNLVCSVKQDDDNIIYFVVGQDEKIKVFDVLEMTELIQDRKVIVNRSEDIDFDKDEIRKSNYYFLPGIDQNLQCQMNILAAKELIPVVCEKSYLNSLGENDRSYIKKHDFSKKSVDK